MVNKNNKIKINFEDEELLTAIGAEVFTSMQEKGMTLKEATGVSVDTLEEIYSLAYTFYNQGKYKESIALFHFLAGAAPDTYKYVLGLAASYHQIKAYEDAAVGFYIALNIEPDNPIPAYYATDCFLKQNMLEEAEEFAEITAMICEERPEFAELKERVLLIKKSLKEKK